MSISAALRALTRTAAAAVPPSSPQPIIPSILSALQTLPTSDGTASGPLPHPTPPPMPPLDPFAPQLSSAVVLDVIRSTQCQQNPLSALHFFRWAASRFLPSPACYAAVVDLLLSHRRFAAAEPLLHAAAAAGCPGHHDFLAAKFIAAYGELGDIRGAIHWFRCRRASLGRYSHGAILCVLVRANRVRLARAVFDDMVAEGRVLPDVATYTTLIRGYCKLGLVAEAGAVFRAMACRPNLVTYNTLVDGYCRRGMMESATAAVERMVQRGDCTPDTITYTTLISGFARHGEPARARNCMEEMVRRWKLQPNLLTYNAMIGGLCAAGDVEGAAAMMARMRLDGVKADLVTHSCLVKGLCAAGRPDEAAAQLKEMARTGIDPDSRAYGPVVREHCRVGRLGDAMAALDEMGRRGVTPHFSLFNALLAALAEEGDLDRAARLLREMPRRGCPPNFLSFSYVIPGLCGRHGGMQQAEELVAAMRRGGHRPDAGMYRAMVEGYCRAGEMGMAAGVFRDMVGEGFAARGEALEALVKGLCTMGKGDDARKLFDEMRRKLPTSYVESCYKRVLGDYLQ